MKEYYVSPRRTYPSKHVLWFGVSLFVLLLGLGFLSCKKAPRPAEEYQRLQSLYVTMRDGVKIAIDVWLPEDLSQEAKIPAIMNCTRYWRASDIVGASLEEQSNYKRAKLFNDSGYALVLVDARGSGASFGSRAYEMTQDEVKDYGEIADWIIAQPWSNGKVGAYGVSYPGNAAEMLMVNQKSAVRAVAPLFSDFNYLDYLVDPGGVSLNFFTTMWGQMVTALDANDICAVQGVSGDECDELKKKVQGVKPVDKDVDRSILTEAVRQHRSNVKVHEETEDLRFRDDPFGPDRITNLHNIANPTGYLKEIEASRTAIFVRVGWLDAGTVNGALSRFLTIHNPQKVIIGPWSHGGRYHTDPFLPPDTPTQPNPQDQTMEMIEFFDLYLKNRKHPRMESSILYYTMGAGTWHETRVWPPKGFTKTDWYFGAEGTLSKEPPSEKKGADSYSINYEATTGKTNRWYTQLGGPDVIYLDRADEDRKLLTYTSAPLESDIEITGHPLVTLFLSSTAKDGAIFVYLEYVDENGQVTYITEGQLRAMCRKVLDEEPPFKIFGPYRTFDRKDAAPLVPGKVAELTFDLWASSFLIKKGHRIRIAIAGADKDSFAQYPQEEKAPTIRVGRNKFQASKIVLPMKEN